MENRTMNTDDGTVLATRPGAAFEQRKIRVRYSGRSLLSLAMLATAIALAFLGRYEWSLLAMSLEVAVLGGLAVRYQRDLKWVTGYDRKPGKN